VGRNRISFTSTSSGWLMAKATARAEGLGRNGDLSQNPRILSAESGSVTLYDSSVATAPGEMAALG
jgi:hypothetical protein